MRLKPYNFSQKTCQSVKKAGETLIHGPFSSFVGGLCFDIRANDKTMSVSFETTTSLSYSHPLLAICAALTKVSFIDAQRFTMKNISNLIEATRVPFTKFIGLHSWRIYFSVLVQIGRFESGWSNTSKHRWSSHPPPPKHLSMLSGRRSRRRCSFVSVKMPSKSGIYLKARKLLLFVSSISYWLLMSIERRLDPVYIARSSEQTRLTSIVYATDSDVSSWSDEKLRMIGRSQCLLVGTNDGVVWIYHLNDLSTLGSVCRVAYHVFSYETWHWCLLFKTNDLIAIVQHDLLSQRSSSDENNMHEIMSPTSVESYWTLRSCSDCFQRHFWRDQRNSLRVNIERRWTGKWN